MADTQGAAGTAAEPFVVGIAVWQGVDLIDMAAPREIFNFMGIVWSRPMQALLVAACDEAVETRDGIRLLPEATFADCPRLDRLFVPDGDPDRLQRQILDCDYLDFLRREPRRAIHGLGLRGGAAARQRRPARRLRGHHPLVVHPAPRDVSAGAGGARVAALRGQPAGERGPGHRRRHLVRVR